MKQVVLSPQAKANLLAIAEYLETESGATTVGSRFLAQFREKFQQYAEFPKMGERREHPHSKSDSQINTPPQPSSQATDAHPVTLPIHRSENRFPTAISV